MKWKGFCSQGSCLEVACEDGAVHVRDSKYAGRGAVSPIISFTPSGWRVFLLVAPEWDRVHTAMISGVELGLCLFDADPVCIRTGAVHLHFSWEEWDAFVKGVEAGEFEATP